MTSSGNCNTTIILGYWHQQTVMRSRPIS